MSALELTDAPATFRVAQQVVNERVRQDEKWGQQNHPDGTGGPLDDAFANLSRRNADDRAKNGTLRWRDILEEEVYEAFAESDPAKLREELLQVAAVASAWVEAIDRRES